MSALRTCKGCGKAGKDRTAAGAFTPKVWACSAECAVKIMKAPDWGVLGWIKVA